LTATILTCPTGALGFRRSEAAPPTPADEPVVVEPEPNGPLLVRGPATIVDGDGNVIRVASRIALCRCGHSNNKPFCDLAHRVAGFRG
jgi:hypothetical protein